MRSPRVSIVTPSYNQAQFLEATIRSVLGQDYHDIEYIVCDGGSTDGSADIIRKYSERLAWWCSERDSGQSDAINKGMDRVTGEIVGWLNSDDVLLPGAVSTIVAAFESHPEAGMIYGGLDIIDDAGKVTGRFDTGPYAFAAQLCHRTIIPQPSSFWLRDVARAVGPLRTDLHFTMDFEYWIRIGQRYPIVHIPDVVAQFRISDVNKGTAQRAGWGPEFIHVLDDLYSQPNLPDSTRALRAHAYAGAFTHGAAWFVAAGDYATARRWIRSAVAARMAITTQSDWWHTALTAILGGRVHAIGRKAKTLLRHVGVGVVAG